MAARVRPGAALMAGAMLAAAAPAAAQLSAPSGVGGVPQATPPPPVSAPVAPSSPPVTVTDGGGGITTYPITPATPPASVPPVPSTSTLPTTDTPATPPADGTTPVAGTGTAPAGPGTPLPAVQAGSQAPLIGPPAPADPAQLRTTGGAVAEGVLVAAFAAGRRNDPTFRAAVSERDINLATANQTITGYLPSASYSLANVPTESGLRQVATVTQPIVSLGGLATVRQRAPRRAYAEATFATREQDLATRLMTAVADLIKANEASRLNQSRIEALRSQSDRAERLYRSGLGTVTDARDIAVRYGQALANQELLEADREAAAARVGSITGTMPRPGDFILPESFPPIGLPPLAQFTQQQASDNPQIEAARQTERINELEAQRVRGSLFPVLGATATYSRRSDITNSYVGLSVTAPFNPASIFQQGAARATRARSFEERRAIEEKARVELQRLYALVSGGSRALAISAQAIEAAQLSVDANTKSYEGGVRTSVDVVNAIQTLFEVRNGYVVSAATLATNLLNLLLLSGVEPVDAMAQTNRFLLDR